MTCLKAQFRKHWGNTKITTCAVDRVATEQNSYHLRITAAQVGPMVLPSWKMCRRIIIHQGMYTSAVNILLKFERKNMTLFIL